MARKYELETIPIWDAFDAETECPLCLLEERAQKRYLDFFLGNSVMVPEMRVEVNRTGFCRAHFVALWEASGNKHPLSLMVHTHLKDLISSVGGHARTLSGRAGDAKRGKTKKQVDTFVGHLRERQGSCMICDRLAYTLDRYAFTIVYLWKTRDEFAEAVARSKGFCLHHLPAVLEMACDQLGGKSLGEFVSTVVDLSTKSLERVEGELDWYTQKFDYQNNDKPWGTSKDAINRALQKITGRIVR